MRARSILAIAMLAAMPLTAVAWPDLETPLTVEWDPSPDAEQVASYCLYYGGESRTYTNAITGLTNCSVRIEGFRRGETYYFAATAVNRQGLEGQFSPELVYTVEAGPAPPPILRITEGQRLTILYRSRDLADWAPVQTNAAPSGSFSLMMDEPKAFYAVRMQ